MEFKIKCVWEFLKKNGEVYTVRNYLMGQGLMMGARLVFVEGIGTCNLKFIKQVYIPKDLKDYVMKSGFYKSINWNVDMGERYAIDWWEVIERFCKNKPKYLYLVVVENVK